MQYLRSSLQAILGVGKFRQPLPPHHQSSNLLGYLTLWHTATALGLINSDDSSQSILRSVRHRAAHRSPLAQHQKF
jgi:hypothetical protein